MATRRCRLREGLTLGFAWAAISVAIDLPIFLYVFHMALADYAADIALTYLPAALPWQRAGCSRGIDGLNADVT